MLGTINGCGSGRRRREPLLGDPEPPAEAEATRVRRWGITSPSCAQSETFFDEFLRHGFQSRELPFVGDPAFARRGRDPRCGQSLLGPTTYERVDPGAGRQPAAHPRRAGSARRRRGRASGQLGLGLEPARALSREKVASRGRGARSEGFRLEDAEASFELLVRRALRPLRAAGRPLAYAVDARRDASPGSVPVDGDRGGQDRGEVLGGSSEVAPWTPLEKAMRRALLPAFPRLTSIWLGATSVADRLTGKGAGRAVCESGSAVGAGGRAHLDARGPHARSPAHAASDGSWPLPRVRRPDSSSIRSLRGRGPTTGSGDATRRARAAAAHGDRRRRP